MDQELVKQQEAESQGKWTVIKIEENIGVPQGMPNIVILKLYLKQCVQFWSPYLKKDAVVQKRETKMMKGWEVPYQQGKAREFGAFNLVKRQTGRSPQNCVYGGEFCFSFSDGYTPRCIAV